MNWHTRYTQQAIWTRELRKYLFDRTELTSAQRVLEVGCGTGAILSEIQAALLTCSGVQRKCHGLDIQPLSLMEARVHAPDASLTRGDALSLPYPNETFDITLCHFLLLWISNPQGALAEMKRVTTQNGHVLALAEPDYTARVDKPAELEILGYWQAKSLQKQGADPSLGGKLAEMFYQAGIELLETGAIERQRDGALTSIEWEMEWAVLEADLTGLVSADEIKRLKIKDKLAWEQGKRTLHVPTYFAWGRV